jgi:hypothetical protein
MRTLVIVLALLLVGLVTVGQISPSAVESNERAVRQVIAD